MGLQKNGGKFEHGFISGIIGKAGGEATDAMGFTGDTMSDRIGRTTIVAVFGGMASQATGGDFYEGAMRAAFVHLYNGEYDTLGKALKGLWNKKGEIMSDAGKGFKGGLEGYRDVRDNSPWYARYLLKIGMTAVELGATKWIKDPALYIYTNVTSAIYLDTIPLNRIAIPASYIHDYSSHDSNWFK